jgi:hypothetical protein
LFANDQFFCFTLEDVSRAEGVKIKGHTCLAPGEYQVGLSMSSRFKRVMPIIYTEANGFEAKGGGISFKGARFHGGNTHLHTDGCPLVAKNRVNADTIQGTEEARLTKLIRDNGGKATLTIVNQNFEG